MVVGRLLSYWEGNFSGAMLDFRGVDICQDVHITSGSTFARPPPKRTSFFYLEPDMTTHVLEDLSHKKVQVNLPQKRGQMSCRHVYIYIYIEING